MNYYKDEKYRLIDYFLIKTVINESYPGMKDLVFVANYNGAILFMSNEGSSLFDLGNKNKRPRANLFELFSEKSNAEVKEKIEEAKKNAINHLEPIIVEKYLNKHCRSLSLRISLFYTNKHELEIIAGHFECPDIDPDSFQLSKQLYLGFIDNLPLGIYRTAASGIVHFANKGLVDMLGYNSVEELYLINIKDLIVDTELWGIALEEWIDDKVHSIEFQMYKKDKEIIWAKNSGRAIRDASGEIVFMDGILEDITKQKENELKLKESENQLKELNTSKDKFFSIISHDLRSPFNQLIGATELLLTKLEEYDKVMIRKFLTLLNKEAVLSYRLLENLLQWSKNQRGLIKMDPKPVNFPGLVEELLLIYEPMALHKKIEMEVIIPKDLYVYADKEMLSTIMRNLISNAIKFTDEGGVITISATEKMDEEDMFSEYLEVSVVDTGTGIPEKDIPGLFEITSGDSAKGTYNETGTGLGLVLCREFVEKHNGRIWAESVYGEGSAFYFTIK